MSRLHRHLFDDEEVVWSSRQHPLALLGDVVPFLMVAGLGTIATGTLGGSPEEGNIVIAAASIATAFFGLRLLKRVLAWRSHRYIITTHRLIETSGSLRRRISSVPLANISTVRVRRSWMGRLFGYGDLNLSAAGKTQRLPLVSRPRQTESAIMRTRPRPLPVDPVGPQAEPPRRVASRYTPRSAYSPAARRDPSTGNYSRDPLPERRARPARSRPIDEGHVFGGRYVLVSRLAAGGMGTVYEGLDGRLGRPVAIKLLREELAGDRNFLERFRREARSVAALSHPSIASVFDYGEDRSVPYIVMELVRGRDLADVLEDEAPLAVERAVNIGRQVLEALDHAHRAGVVHRDVKPANILVDEHDRIKVTDFGIARAAGVSRLTATGILLGSAHYASPEQIDGRVVSPQSDIYSAGILLYEMLVGNPPFSGQSPLQVAERHLSEEVPEPSLSNAAVPQALDDIVVRATARRPERRFARAGDMAEALGRLQLPGSDVLQRANGAHLAVHPFVRVEDLNTPPMGGRHA
jgi:membrane protein YdbS with pleckstrin-like domain/predicted Ser/Thr protein kinase